MNEDRVAVRPPYVAVIGDGDPRGHEAHRILEWAEEVGLLLARGGAVVITGGLGGVMRAASRGATSGGGEAIGLAPALEAAGRAPLPVTRSATLSMSSCVSNGLASQPSAPALEMAA